MELLKSRKNLPQGVYLAGLVFVIVIWGICPVLTTKMYNWFSPTVYTTMTGFIASSSLFLISGKKIKFADKSMLKVSLITGLVNAAAVISQKIGLQYSTPSRSAFLDTLSCVVVPALMFLLTKKKPSVFKVIAAVLCLTGCFVLTGGDLSDGGGFGIGEFLCALAGILYGVNMVLTSLFAEKIYPPVHVMLHMAIQCVVSITMATALDFANIEPMRFTLSLLPILGVIGLTLVANVVGWLIRITALKKLDATIVAVMMPLSSVVTGTVSVLAGTDALTRNLVLGGGLVVCASILSNLNIKRR